MASRMFHDIVMNIKSVASWCSRHLKCYPQTEPYHKKCLIYLFARIYMFAVGWFMRRLTILLQLHIRGHNHAGLDIFGDHFLI